MSKKKIPDLSKSRFVGGLQCHLRLWYSTYEKELEAPPSESLQFIFSQGTEFGKLATTLYPGGILVNEAYYEHDKAIQHTQQLILNEEVSALFEAAFTYDNVKVRADILVRLNNSDWQLLEVKSSTSVKDVN